MLHWFVNGDTKYGINAITEKAKCILLDNNDFTLFLRILCYTCIQFMLQVFMVSQWTTT